MKLPARVGLITLACRDVERMAQLFRDLGWPETPESDEHHRTFQCTNGVVVRALRRDALRAGSSGRRRTASAASRSPSTSSRSTRRRRSTRRCKTVDGVELLDEPAEAFWGGGFSWRDPEGNVWDVAWAKGTTLDDRGGLTFP